MVLATRRVRLRVACGGGGPPALPRGGLGRRRDLPQLGTGARVAGLLVVAAGDGLRVFWSA
eukprot:8140049-Alexandrium_andersonii.AAC.1